VQVCCCAWALFDYMKERSSATTHLNRPLAKIFES
jgi:hypothetical protein